MISAPAERIRSKRAKACHPQGGNGGSRAARPTAPNFLKFKKPLHSHVTEQRGRVGALRKCAGGTFLASDRSGYAARRELRGAKGPLHVKINAFFEQKLLKKSCFQGVKKWRRHLFDTLKSRNPNRIPAFYYKSVALWRHLNPQSGYHIAKQYFTAQAISPSEGRFHCEAPLRFARGFLLPFSSTT